MKETNTETWKNSTCPHDCPSACALQVEKLADGYAAPLSMTIPTALSVPRSRNTPNALIIPIG